MRLKSLDIKGFKSFPDKTHISLDHPITGIVGPNGCGKSNIIDAIRWVIGEHKIKSLRSDNLDDLVFNGSKSRPASGMAEVSITFDNTRNILPTEFSTITITRKFYKSGESEYRLNDTICRLKDIHNLLMDTGVSSDSYAIIELGMVDDIIKDKEGSRRRMLEQAAGISIYKTRKKETQQKLNATESDLSRIEDLLYEISNNLRTLEGQAKKAERYYQIKKDYKQTSIELAKASLEEYNGKYQELNAKLKEEEDKKIKIDSEISGDEANIERNKNLLVKEEQELSFAQKKFNDLINRIRILENEKKLSAQHLNHLKEREQSLHSNLENAKSQLGLLKESIHHSQENLVREKENLENFRDNLEEQRVQLDEKRVNFDLQKQKIEGQRNYIQQIQHKQFDLEKHVAVGDSNLMSLKKNQFQIEEENQQRNLQIENLKNEEINLISSIDLKNEELNTFIITQNNLQKNIDEKEKQLEDFRQLLIKNNRQLDAKNNEHELLKSLMESLEDYPDSIKFLKKNNDWQSEALLLSDIFIVEEEYRIALETVLDNYLNYYIVQNMEEASQAIHLLQTNKKGKANFFLLNQYLNYTTLSKKAPDHLIPALEVIKVDTQYRNLVHFLLDEVYISDSEHFQTEHISEEMIIVEKKGTYLRGKYFINGGSVGIFEGNKIGRVKNIERLQKEIDSLNTQTDHLESQIRKYQQELIHLKSEIKNLPIELRKREINQLENQINNLQNRKEHFLQLNENSESKLIEIQEQIADRMEEMEDAKIDLEDINEDLEELKSNLNESSAAFSVVEQDYNFATQQYNNQNLSLAKQQSIIEGLKQEINFKSNQVIDLEKQIDTNTKQILETSQKISETSGKLNFGDNELQDLIEQKEIDEQVLNEKDRAYYAFRKEISDHEQKISKQRREKEQAETLLQTVKDKLSEMKLQVAGMKERLSVEFKVTLEDILEESRETEFSINELQTEADRLKKRLENIGEINPTAIEAYQEIKIRHDFIVEQKEDLEDAKGILLKTIEEVERTANAKFKETFEQVSINFKQVFQTLFTKEDHADLRLTNPEDVAESGIEIYAQPKGKRPSTLTQLSGGEKTLTSTAFLFAIYLIKPAPFCILDEVDAPLDDANVGKFTQMIRQFSNNSQFIIVTHNKQTMAAVDVIYGVTMQESGVSKIVPVDFRSLSN